ncbi:MAG TPA: LamG-like jellyroll fold domain-containing protein [Candidatus Cybelea sp.]
MLDAGKRAYVFAFLCLALLSIGAACSGHSTSLPPMAAARRGHVHPNDASQNYATVILGDKPTGYYRLDDTGAVAADSTGNGYVGAVGASVQESATGLIAGSDNAMALPGTATAAGIVSFPEIKAMEPATNASLEAWLRFTKVPKIYTVAVAYGSDRGDAPFDLFFRSGGTIVAQFNTTGGVLEVVGPALAANTTYHVVSTYNGTTGSIYVNGVLAATANKSGTLTGYVKNFGFAIGDDAAFADPAFAGTLDEVAIYANQTLTAAQVANHYTAGTTGASPTPSPTPAPTATPAPTPTPMPTGNGNYPTVVLGDGPTAYYHLDDSGTTAADASGNGLNGSVGSSVKTGAAGLLLAYADAAMSFPGTAATAGTVSVPATSKLQPASAVSLEAWLSFPKTPATYTFAVGYGSDSLYAPYGLFFRASGQILAQFYTTAGILEVGSTVHLSPNTAYYVAGTYDGTTGRLYINGVQNATATLSGTFKNYSPQYGFSIGNDAGHSDPAFSGTLDEVAVYAGKVLTATQVQNHYVAGTSGQGATPSPSPSPTPTPAAATDWDSFGFDLQRTGYNPNETTISPNNVGSLQQVWVYNVGSTMVHEPVYAYGVSVGGQPTNIIYAGSQYGSTMYAINASTGATVWSDPVASSSYKCGKSSSQFGVGETPAIDRAKNLLYFADGQNQVHAVDLATGKEAGGWPLTVANYTPDHNFMHGGLTYNPATGMLYAVSGSTCDISPWYGRIVAISTTGPGIAGTFFTMSGNATQGPSGGGIWGPGGGSIDPSNNDVFVATGNADTSTGGSQSATYAEQVLDLSPTLGTVLANNYPTNIPTVVGDDDFDFGATPLIFQPPGCPTLVAAINKSGMFELYDESTISSGPVQYLAMSVPTDSASFVGVPAYDPATGFVYVGMPSTDGPYQPGLAAFGMQSNCTLNPTPVWAASFGPDGAGGGQTPRSPISIANGVVYVSNYTGDTEYAYNAASGTLLWTDPLSSWGNVGTVIANGMAYVSAADGTITAWALPGQAQILRKRVRANKHSFVPRHHHWPRDSWSPWDNSAHDTRPSSRHRSPKP